MGPRRPPPSRRPEDPERPATQHDDPCQPSRALPQANPDRSTKPGKSPAVTTQADTLAQGLGLSAADRLLDLGSGRGWPGLYLAARTGCAVVLTDLPLAGLRVAAARAAAEGLASRAEVVVSAASALPFRARSFDAVIHADVLC